MNVSLDSTFLFRSREGRIELANNCFVLHLSHVVTIDVINIKLSASEVKVGGAKSGLRVVSLGLFSFLHKADEGNDTGTRADHDDRHVMRLGHCEVRILHKAD